MATIDFPDSPTIGDIFAAGNSSYQWTGTAWIANNLGALNYTDIANKPAAIVDAAAIQSFVDGRIALTVDAAPDALNTLNELAASLADDDDFAGTMTAALAGKAAIVHGHAVSDVTGLQDALDARKLETTYEIAANNTLLAGGRYMVNTTAARTLTLPSAPAVGAEVQVIDQDGTAGTHNITIDNNGLKINGVVDTLVLDVNGASAGLIYTGATLGWRI
tara:strand:- start:1491 stop:2147 length:657 start_codon:yes stop_codon:yes gene_type:complete